MLDKIISIDCDAWRETKGCYSERVSIPKCPICGGLMLVKALSHDEEPEVTYGHYKCLNSDCGIIGDWDCIDCGVEGYYLYEYEVGMSGVSAPTKIYI